MNNPVIIGEEKLKVLDLFSGIGGFSLGLERTGGFETVAFCEIEPFPRKVLAKHWPKVPCYEDVTKLTGQQLAADGIAVDVITGGFPCQDISLANSGSMSGLDGEKSGLWREFKRLIQENKPTFVIIENSPVLRSRGLGQILNKLCSLGYDAEWHCIPATAVDAPHTRDRVWIIAYPIGLGDGLPEGQVLTRGHFIKHVSRWSPEPSIPRVDDGQPNRIYRHKAHGNGIVSQIPEIIGMAILEVKQDTLL